MTWRELLALSVARGWAKHPWNEDRFVRDLMGEFQRHPEVDSWIRNRNVTATLTPYEQSAEASRAAYG